VERALLRTLCQRAAERAFHQGHQGPPLAKLVGWWRYLVRGETVAGDELEEFSLRLVRAAPKKRQDV
jgi:hypothetical protein